MLVLLSTAACPEGFGWGLGGVGGPGDAGSGSVGSGAWLDEEDAGTDTGADLDATDTGASVGESGPSEATASATDTGSEETTGVSDSVSAELSTAGAEAGSANGDATSDATGSQDATTEGEVDSGASNTAEESSSDTTADEASSSGGDDDDWVVDLLPLDPTDKWGTSAKDVSLACPAGQVLVGADVYYSFYTLQGVRGVCGRPEYDDEGEILAIEVAEPTAFAGSKKGEPQRRLCPQDAAVSSFSLRVDDRGISYWELSCAEFELRPGMELERGPQSALQGVGVSSKFQTSGLCGSNGWATGLELDVSSYINAFGMTCARPSLRACDAQCDAP